MTHGPIKNVGNTLPKLMLLGDLRED